MDSRCSWGHIKSVPVFLFPRNPHTLPELIYLTYSCRLRVEHRAATTPRQRTLFWAAFFSWVHVIPAAFTSLSADLLHVCFGLPTFLFPCGFQSKACLVTLSAGFLSVWPIQPHFHFLMVLLTGLWLVRFHKSVSLPENVSY
jgi:hypothetical protein